MADSFQKYSSNYEAEENKERLRKTLENARAAIIFHVEGDVDDARTLVAASAFLNEETEDRDIASMYNAIVQFLNKVRDSHTKGEDHDRPQEEGDQAVH